MYIYYFLTISPNYFNLQIMPLAFIHGIPRLKLLINQIYCETYG